jgi:hypothetical protein
MSYTDALAQIGQIQAQISALGSAFIAPAPASAAGTSSGAAGTSFADELSQAQASGLPQGQPTASSASLPAGAGHLLTSGQQQFAARLAADTGMSPQVVSAWVLAEESGGAATARQSAGNNDWLNIGYTDTSTYGAADSVWGDPTSAADATAGWLKGQNTIPGYGTASSGVQGILATAGQAPAAQISAIQQSGWASGGYPELSSLYTEVG